MKNTLKNKAKTLKLTTLGFTLIELLAVIVIISILSLIFIPKIVERFNTKQEETSELAKEVLYSATREYITSNQYLFNTGVSYHCVTIKELVEDGKLTEPVVDVKTGNIMNANVSVEVTEQNNQYHFEYNTARCTTDLINPTMTVQLIPGIVDKTKLKIRINAVANGTALHEEAYSFNNGQIWQREKEKEIDSYYSNILKVRNKENLEVQRQINIGKVTINTNGGVWNTLTAGDDIIWLQIGETKTISNPIKINYTFNGWTKSGASGSINGSTITMGNTDMILTAKWVPITYTITYNLNGGTTNNPTSYNIETSTFSLNNPTRANYKFTGWSGTNIPGTSMNVSINKGSSGNRSYTAGWQILNYTVTLDNQGATTAGTTSVVATYGSAMPNITIPIKNGFTFGGYYAGTSGSGTQYYTPSGTSATAWNVESAVTLYAKWIGTRYRYRVCNNCAKSAWESTSNCSSGGNSSMSLDEATWADVFQHNNQCYQGGSCSGIYWCKDIHIRSDRCSQGCRSWGGWSEWYSESTAPYKTTIIRDAGYDKGQYIEVEKQTG